MYLRTYTAMEKKKKKMANREDRENERRKRKKEEVSLKIPTRCSPLGLS